MSGPTRDAGSSELRAGPPPVPRWVKVLGLIALIAIVAFAIIHAARSPCSSRRG